MYSHKTELWSHTSQRKIGFTTMICKNCNSERRLIKREYEMGTESYCSFECYQMGIVNTKYIKKLLSIDDIAEQGGRCIILEAVLKIAMESQFERAEAELDRMIETEICGRNEIYIKRISRVVSFYRHIAIPEINHPTSLKLAMKYVACRILEGMISEGTIDVNLVESYLKDNPNIVDFKRHICSLCNDIKPLSGCELNHNNL